MYIIECNGNVFECDNKKECYEILDCMKVLYNDDKLAGLVRTKGLHDYRIIK